MAKHDKDQLLDLFQNASIRREAMAKATGEARRDTQAQPPMPRWRKRLAALEQRTANLPWRKIGKGVGAGVLLVALVFGWQHRGVLNDHATRLIAEATGATVQRIEVVGLTYTQPQEVLTALRLQRGSSLVGFDASAARTRLEALPWVRLASVERQLPATVRVEVYEHLPLARMISESVVLVLNPEGEPIVADSANQFGNLPLLQGEGAPTQAAALFDALKPYPNLLAQLREATWVGQRRWDLTFVSGVTVMLPEEGDDKGLDLLNQLEEARHVLTLNDGTVDLRLPDRIVLRLPETVGMTPVTVAPVSTPSTTATTTPTANTSPSSVGGTQE